MNNSELENEVNQSFQEFTNLEKLQPSDAWKLQVIAKLNSPKQRKEDLTKTLSVAAFIALFIGLNMYYFLVIQTSHNSVVSSANRKTELQTISSEILINPLTLNN